MKNGPSKSVSGFIRNGKFLRDGTIVVNAELASACIVQDPVPMQPRKVQVHAYKTGCLTIEVHDPLAEGIRGSLLLHFDAHALMGMLTTAMLNSDA